MKNLNASKYAVVRWGSNEEIWAIFIHNVILNPHSKFTGGLGLIIVFLKLNWLISNAAHSEGIEDYSHRFSAGGSRERESYDKDKKWLYFEDWLLFKNKYF